MVTITATEKRSAKSGKEFNVMVLQGDIEIAVSKETGKPYLTARKTSIPCTFDERLVERCSVQTLSPLKSQEPLKINSAIAIRQVPFRGDLGEWIKINLTCIIILS